MIVSRNKENKQLKNFDKWKKKKFVENKIRNSVYFARLITINMLE